MGTNDGAEHRRRTGLGDDLPEPGHEAQRIGADAHSDLDRMAGARRFAGASPGESSPLLGLAEDAGLHYVPCEPNARFPLLVVAPKRVGTAHASVESKRSV